MVLKRNHEIKVRLNEDEIDALNHSSHRCQLSREAYIRMRLKGYQPKASPSVELKKVLDLLWSISNNINQITRYCHLTGHLDEKQYKNNYEALIKLIHEIKQLIILPEKDSEYGNH